MFSVRLKKRISRNTADTTFKVSKSSVGGMESSMELKLVFTNLVKDVPFYRKLDLYF